MATSFSSVQLERFRRDAKKLSRELSITHSAALDRIAAQQGYKNWSLLAKHSEESWAPSPATVQSTTTPLGAVRYYLHGDQVEEDLARYYCARCDAFVDAAHFDDRTIHDNEGHLERFLASLKRWSKRSPVSKSGWRRPDDAPNLLADQLRRHGWQLGASATTMSAYQRLQLHANIGRVRLTPSALSLHPQGPGAHDDLWLPTLNADGSVRLQNCSTGHLFDLTERDVADIWADLDAPAGELKYLRVTLRRRLAMRGTWAGWLN